MDEPLTKSLDRYDVLDRIAVGGMAEVFLAKAYGAHGFEKTLAIKRILPELARDPEFEARFIAEAKVAVKLSHANVVQVLDFGRIGESLFIAMEYVDGLDLAAMLRKFKDEKRMVPLPAAFHIAIEIVRALDFAHGHNIVHRDVSPSNVLISRAGEVKLADFGIAIAAQPHRGGGTGPRKVMGKWRYMSPEQTRGDTLDTRSDLFSAASVIFEVFTGEKLFPGDEAEDIIKNIHDMPIPKMSSLRPGLPSRLDDVIGTALARKPIDRPTRPATVLRQLIELSYESSIMATALDVADALATVIPAKRLSGRGALDDVIRKQLHDQSVARRTAVTDGKPPSTETLERDSIERGDLKGERSTGLFRKVDIDGLSRLEEIDAPTSVAGPRARRATEEQVAVGNTDLHSLYDIAHDRDRHTEVGGPPTGQVPKVGASSSNLPVEPTDTGSVGGGKLARFAIIGVVVIAAVVLAVWKLAGGGGPTSVTAADAAVIAPKTGTLLIESDPPGASGYLEAIGPRRFRQAIASAAAGQRVKIENLPPDEKYKLHLELAGYLPYEETVNVTPGETFLVHPRLVRAPSKLHVVTDPPGAGITLAGRRLDGETPKTFEGLTAGSNLTLILDKPGYTTITLHVDLAPGETTEISESLKAVAKFGYVKFAVKSPTGVPIMSANVSRNGVALGRTGSLSGPRTFRLPVGTQRLVVSRAGVGKAVVTVEVTEGAARTIAVKLKK